jgi:hypothetical protein
LQLPLKKKGNGKMEWNKETLDNIINALKSNGYDDEMAFECARQIQKEICQWNDDPKEVLYSYGLTLREIGA